MKKYLSLSLILPAICFTIHANAQMVGEEGVRLLEFRDADGTLFKSGNELGVRGTPMVEDGWGQGTIRFKNGLVFADSAINISLYNGRLYMCRNNRYVEFVQPAASVSLNFKLEDYTSVSHQFQSGFPAVADLSENTLYEVLYEGNDLKLLVFLRKKVVDPNNYGGPTQKEYSLVRQLFLFKPSEQKMVPLKTYSADAVMSSLPSYSNGVMKYLAAGKKNPRNKEQFLDLLAYLDK